jgi:hypothetical protein
MVRHKVFKTIRAKKIQVAMFTGFEANKSEHLSHVRAAKLEEFEVKRGNI